MAFDLAAYLLVMDTSTRGTERPADIRLVRTSLRPMGRNGESDFAAASPGEKLDSPPAGKWMKLGDDLKRFDAFRALPDAEKQDLFARAVSAALHNQAANQHRALPIGERVVELLDIDFARAVRPTEKYFWKRLTRARMLEIAEAVVGAEWAKARRNHKKGQLAADMAAVFGDDPQGRAALDAEARERVEQWAMPGFGRGTVPPRRRGDRDPPELPQEWRRPNSRRPAWGTRLKAENAPPQHAIASRNRRNQLKSGRISERGSATEAVAQGGLRREHRTDDPGEHGRPWRSRPRPQAAPAHTDED